MNLYRPEEVYIISDAVRAMVFRLTRDATKHIVVLHFEEREVFRVDTKQRKLYLTGLSGIPEVVYTFSRWRIGDRLMWRSLNKSFEFFWAVSNRIRLQDYRAMFGRQMNSIIERLANLMEAAEREALTLQKIDRTQGGYDLHPEISRMIQYDPESGETA